ncbi:hypothetical protein VNO80_01331 [Phaseolus coccineus]|uniref:Uncharacterized protein n=1 Tax=Phaseolus coccineus TaxID=3886 RepID=A0AAN9RSP0_PHACN
MQVSHRAEGHRWVVFVREDIGGLVFARDVIGGLSSRQWSSAKGYRAMSCFTQMKWGPGPSMSVLHARHVVRPHHVPVWLSTSTIRAPGKFSASLPIRKLRLSSGIREFGGLNLEERVFTLVQMWGDGVAGFVSCAGVLMLDAKCLLSVRDRRFLEVIAGFSSVIEISPVFVLFENCLRKKSSSVSGRREEIARFASVGRSPVSCSLIGDRPFDRRSPFC